jgi:hypothetical protein
MSLPALEINDPAIGLRCRGTDVELGGRSIVADRGGVKLLQTECEVCMRRGRFRKEKGPAKKERKR